MSRFVKVGLRAQFPEGRTSGVVVSEKKLCVARLGNQFFAMDDSCTHAASPLADCLLEGDEVVCPLHGARFDVKTGTPKTLPATEAVPTHEVKLEGEDVYIKV